MSVINGEVTGGKDFPTFHWVGVSRVGGTTQRHLAPFRKMNGVEFCSIGSFNRGIFICIYSGLVFLTLKEACLL